MAKDKDGKNGRDNHSGSVAAEDSELTLWLSRLWERNEPPERIELWQTFGRNKVVRGELIHHEDFKPNEKLDIEQANKLANEIMAAAQNDCDSARRESWYQLAVIDRNRRSSPLVRRIGPLQCKRSYAIATLNDVDNEDDESVDAKSLEIRYIKEGLEQSRWDKNRYDKVMGEMLMLQGHMIGELRQQNERLFSQHMEFFGRLQDAEDRKAQREVLLEREKFKLGLMKEGVRTARNLLPNLFGGAEGGNAANGPSNGHDTTVTKTYGPSPQRTLIDNFLRDCEEAEIDIALFGDFEDQEGKLVQVKPGIFSLKQFSILVGVRDGRLSTDTLDDLMPNSGHENAITEEQIKKAGDAGVTEGIGMALLELVGLQQRIREARENNDTPPKDQVVQ